MDWFWRERRRRRKDAKAQEERFASNPLREFVYLDEVSVTSLVSSILGKVPSEFTDTSTIAAKTQRNAGFDTGAGPLKVKVGFTNESTRTDDAKVQSKATVQALFKRLYLDVQPGLVIQLPDGDSNPPSAREVEGALLNGENDEARKWISHPASLKRGSLAELEIELEADPVFRLSAIMTTFTELVSEGKEQLGGVDPKVFSEMVSINSILEKLLAGLVPLKCRVVDYVVVRTPLGETLIHHAAIDALPPDIRPHTRDVFLVGVVERSSFWKDIRRILFSKARFRVLCRLNADGVTQEWTPVKLVHLFNEVAPEIGSAIRQFSSGAIQSFSTPSGLHAEVPPNVLAFIKYGQLVSEQIAVELGVDDLHQIVEIATTLASAPADIDHQRVTFAKVAEVILAKSATAVDPAALSQFRMQALEECGLLPGTEVRSKTVDTDQGPTDVDERYLDAELIAIYW